MEFTIDLEKYKQHYLDFIDYRKTLIISSTDEQGEPFVSYAPFVKKDGKLYIYISRIADHYRLIERSACLHVMLLADESESPNLFGLERVRWRCVPRHIGNEGSDSIFELFEERHSAKLMNVLRGLDFSLFELAPGQGRYVAGFGKAFDVDLDGNLFTQAAVDKNK
ncbi:HugZ family pyridoxamine 5'-phosphate oxidase [Paenibacillus apiarius]|uniref:Pyridoxamine 5'-phosphate oxidase family protein n=1 Tax=Paenibacillus apiarius TaxID=46240 RepID=A0ABT4DQB6_9BACL|nr:pyridoxamine 5'-phosphate oxidase family protein [Paenibacillus apiarius]MCY9513908.1 pyridoxamine 5'-phosphate oxidase family protein [Paenibacillus apiarius]MCY9519425.1 pyridoxamine 5'-phosphate oxidase family protein [Paenibacillus apiarius]MCY9552348.1 pyridoxamine 5'-phosphate oxidase family protein [Paenibacillus apiarius]MCY9556180.1 pyridoxamine 5'-phosphate oxidase family protein [Paenibacillus apiarius]MCY9681715.1 pyridoxamine 5'-phosphate oxidase family protein [Paenibacillus a